MEPFQVNCSELIADFGIHEDKDVRELITFLAEEYDIRIFFEITVDERKEFCFSNNFCFDVEINHIPFKISVNTGFYDECWTARLKDKGDLEKLIRGIESHGFNSNGEVVCRGSNSIARELRDKIIILLQRYHTEIENKLITQVNIDEIFDIDIKLGNGSSLTSLRYGSNGHDDLLGWYFACESHDKMNFPFFEWAEKEHNAKIRSFGGGSGYDEFLENPNRERLEY